MLNVTQRQKTFTCQCEHAGLLTIDLLPTARTCPRWAPLPRLPMYLACKWFVLNHCIYVYESLRNIWQNMPLNLATVALIQDFWSCYLSFSLASNPPVCEGGRVAVTTGALEVPASFLISHQIISVQLAAHCALQIHRFEGNCQCNIWKSLAIFVSVKINNIDKCWNCYCYHTITVKKVWWRWCY